MSDAGHRIVKYLCGEHVESQCRCMMQNKPVIIGTTPCPTCQLTAREVLDGIVPIRDAYDLLASRVEVVLALHSVGDVGLPPSARPRCKSCREHWPCPTVRALNGKGKS
jgi:hypothetical protein